MKRRSAVIAYDISDARNRRQVFKLLQQWRIDGQKSVHECLLSTREAEEIYLQLAAIIDEDTDRLMLAWLTPNGHVEGRGLGVGTSLFRRMIQIR